ncbi:MAG: hypothetical protein NC933_01155 [Candidatus Omnitrophica bacterium]|nr:hypothetical protein [Candidatus Omnitrophota bacterium]
MATTLYFSNCLEMGEYSMIGKTNEVGEKDGRVFTLKEAMMPVLLFNFPMTLF